MNVGVDRIIKYQQFIQSFIKLSHSFKNRPDILVGGQLSEIGK